MPTVAGPESASGEGADSYGRQMIDKPTERRAGPMRFATFNFEKFVQPGDVVGGCTDP
jgi:hypothetical protein